MPFGIVTIHEIKKTPTKIAGLESTALADLGRLEKMQEKLAKAGASIDEKIANVDQALDYLEVDASERLDPSFARSINGLRMAGRRSPDGLIFPPEVTRMRHKYAH